MKPMILGPGGSNLENGVRNPKKPEFWGFLGFSSGHLFLVFFGLFLVQPKMIIDSFLSRSIYKYFFINIIEVIDKSL
jgi:hypothetical protein